jgi:hypothetical protein
MRPADTSDAPDLDHVWPEVVHLMVVDLPLPATRRNAVHTATCVGDLRGSLDIFNRIE